MKKIVFKFSQSFPSSEYFFLISTRGKTGDRVLCRSSDMYKNLEDVVHAAGLIMAHLEPKFVVIQSGNDVPPANLAKFLTREFPETPFVESDIEIKV